MSYPHVTFRKSAKRDFETLCSFAQEAKYSNGRFLKWAVLNVYPRLKPQFDESYNIKDERVLRQFVFKKYRAKQKRMAAVLARHQKHWEEIASNYFLLVDELFNGRHWPRGKYIAYGTIWGMYPRDLKDKTFQIPYWHRTNRYSSAVIAHELLHFLFYDYFYARHPKYRCPKYNFLVWHISEIFNTLIQNSPTWLDCFRVKLMGYPEHKKIVKRLSRTWYHRKKWNLDILVAEIIKEVRNQKIKNSPK